MEENTILLENDGNKKSQISKTTFHASKVVSLASAHGIHDVYSSFLAPLLPVLITRLSLLKVEAGAFMIFQQMPSVLQPVIGHLADRYNFKRLVLLAPAVTAVAMSLFAVARSYWMAAILLIISGMASAILHAVAPAIISRFSGRQLGRGMSFWTISGEIGVMVGPILIASDISIFSVQSAPWLMVGGIAASVGLSYLLKDVEFHSAELIPKTLKGSGKKILKIFMPLAGILIARAMLRAAVETYMPVYLTEKGASLWLAGSSLTLLEAAGIIGILIAAGINDRLGPRWIFLGSLLGSPLMLYLFLQSSGSMQIVMMILLGIISLCVVPIGMAVIQENFPENRSFANGLYLAILFLANSTAGVAMGGLADQFGTPTAFLWSVWVCLLGVPFIFLLPKPVKNPEK
jgi:FSR family fosmidomycin resistance protein-like MFS transporter